MNCKDQQVIGPRSIKLLLKIYDIFFLPEETVLKYWDDGCLVYLIQYQ
jgi:hypothetical protein